MSSSIMTIFSALALGHSLFLASYFWAPVKKSPSRFFLALLLTALAVRILKSVLVILIPQSPYIIPAVELVGLSAIGPSLFLYSKSAYNVLFQFKNDQLIHFIPSISLIVLIPFLGETEMFVAYRVTVAHMFAYISWSSVHICNRRNSYRKTEYQWLGLLIGAISVIWLTFFAQLLIEKFITYLAITITASVALYGLSIWAQKKGNLFKEPRRHFLDEDPNKLNKIGEKIRRLFDQENLYTDSNLTVKSIREKLEQPEYLVSQSINFYFKRSFPELLNEYRIIYASKLICSEEHNNLSIEGIAYESGYNSISAFYRAFKKIKGMTPANFKETMLKTA
jgi:AraC-like DNA-binding protein